MTVRLKYDGNMINERMRRHWLQPDLKPLPLSGDRCGLVVGGFMVEVYVGPLHAVDFQQPLQRPICPHRYRRGHRTLWTLWVFRHLQRSTLDVETGAFSWFQQQVHWVRWLMSDSILCSTPCFWLWSSWQNSSLESLDSFFVMRWRRKKTIKRNAQLCCLDNTLHSCPSVCVQIKGTFLMTYNEAVMSYDGLDDRSLAVDAIQRRVSVGPFLTFKQMIWLILIKTPGLH